MSEEVNPQVVHRGAIHFSSQIDKLISAFVAAQAAMPNAIKEAFNPHLKSKYADLASVREATLEHFHKNKIGVIQSPSAEGASVTVTTMLMHESAQWMASDLTLMAASTTPQAIGSAITYARRYALMSFAGIAPEDDDGQPTNPPPGPRRPAPPKQPSAYEKAADAVDSIKDMAVLEKIVTRIADHKELTTKDKDALMQRVAVKREGLR
jgi:hypothetical protein